MGKGARLRRTENALIEGQGIVTLYLGRRQRPAYLSEVPPGHCYRRSDGALVTRELPVRSDGRPIPSEPPRESVREALRFVAKTAKKLSTRVAEQGKHNPRFARERKRRKLEGLPRIMSAQTA